MEELRCCPFCGNDAELVRGEDDFYIFCPTCKMCAKTADRYDNITDTCDKTIETWNRRVGDGHKGEN